MDETARTLKVDAWLASTGYPVEYAAVSVLEQVGFGVDGGRFYQPSEGGARREVDLVARTRGHNDDPPNYVRLVAECKYAKNPWVVLTREREVKHSDVLGWTIASEEARRILVGRARRASAGFPLWLATPKVHGSSIVAAAGRPDESKDYQTPHNALIQVTAAARGIVAEEPGARSLAWPVLIVRGPLYMARLNHVGELRAEPIHWQRIVWGGVTGDPTVIDVVQDDHLAAYGRDAFEGLRATEAALRSGFGPGEE